MPLFCGELLQLLGTKKIDHKITNLTSAQCIVEGRPPVTHTTTVLLFVPVRMARTCDLHDGVESNKKRQPSALSLSPFPPVQQCLSCTRTAPTESCCPVHGGIVSSGTEFFPSLCFSTLPVCFFFDAVGVEKKANIHHPLYSFYSDARAAPTSNHCPREHFPGAEHSSPPLVVLVRARARARPSVCGHSSAETARVETV